MKYNQLKMKYGEETFESALSAGRRNTNGVGKLTAARKQGMLLSDAKWLADNRFMCFMAGTQVITQDGLVPIENIKKLDSVLSKSTKDGKQDYKKVLNLFVTHPTELFHITYKDAKGEAYTLKTTGEHPFFVSDKGWVTARELSIADRLQLADDSTVAISGITTEKAKDGTFTTYNFEVEDYHTYFVLPEGKTDSKYAVWVHNNGDECAEIVGAGVSWNTARKQYWKNLGNEELVSESGKYSSLNIQRMLKGRAPQFFAKVQRRNTGEFYDRYISIELHHKYLPNRLGTSKAHQTWNLEEVTPWAHEAMDEYRHVGYDLIKIYNGTNSR